jgi:hypothetical protein
MTEWLLRIYENGELVGGVEVVDDQPIIRGDPASLVRVVRQMRDSTSCENWRALTSFTDRTIYWQDYEWPEYIEVQ